MESGDTRFGAGDDLRFAIGGETEHDHPAVRIQVECQLKQGRTVGGGDVDQYDVRNGAVRLGQQRGQIPCARSGYAIMGELSGEAFATQGAVVDDDDPNLCCGRHYRGCRHAVAPNVKWTSREYASP